MDINYIQNSIYKRLYLDDVIDVRSRGLNDYSKNTIYYEMKAYLTFKKGRLLSY